MDDRQDVDRDYDLGQDAERLIGQIEVELQYDERGRSYLRKEKILNLVFRVTDFMRQLSKRI